MTTSRSRNANRTSPDRVTPAEIFFDVVFVFTLTQLTRILEAELSPASVGRVLLLFGMLWMVYSGYVWLPNQVSPRSAAQKLLLFVGMAGFLIAAVGTPRAFTDTGVAFGVGYAVVTCVHLLMFTQADRRALWQLWPYNIGAVLVLGGGLAGGTAQYVLWLAAFALQAVSPYLVPVHSRIGGLSAVNLATAHFVERHGLLVIIALGESVVAIGMGVDVDHLTAGTIAVTVLALALPAGLWWAYFTDTRATEAVLDGAEVGPRVRLGVWMGFAHTPLLLGIVVAAVGIHAAVAHPGDPAPWPSALALAGGVAMFLAGIAAARRALRTAPARSRLVTAAVVLATVPIGTFTNSGLHLAVLIVVVVAMLVLDARARTAARREPEVG
ncbi:low temperature requirement protein A [Micromonospora sp. NBC_00898]|uniref:low temperature requirement protein A n=1 Tax=Micromonospora sp. NBC_00898 TaxID=2975981 RepID=UPI003863A153|nr:low temperature requirement protein A [Micromonospora sp. NBC_00898]